MDYKALGFDYGGVIGGVGSTGSNFTQKMCEVLDINETQYKDLYFSMNYMINTGKIDNWHGFWKLFLERLGKPEKYQAVVTLSDEADKLLQEVDSKMLSLVDSLCEKGYKVGLLSNTTAEHSRQMRDRGVDKHFDVFHTSAETKLMKPDPKAFARLAIDLGVQPAEMIFIDDAQKSLSTAEECGFTPILFKSYEQLQQKLNELGIL